eukprot:88021-Amorphochlora_amoeboformis.AAC.1
MRVQLIPALKRLLTLSTREFLLRPLRGFLVSRALPRQDGERAGLKGTHRLFGASCEGHGSMHFEEELTGAWGKGACIPRVEMVLQLPQALSVKHQRLVLNNSSASVLCFGMLANIS